MKPLKSVEHGLLSIFEMLKPISHNIVHSLPSGEKVNRYRFLLASSIEPADQLFEQLSRMEEIEYREMMTAKL